MKVRDFLFLNSNEYSDLQELFCKYTEYCTPSNDEGECAKNLHDQNV